MSEKLETQPIHKEDWDYLIILDACRYDVFEEVYEEYFEGELSKVESRGSNTTHWLPATFDRRYNYTYLSGNPFVNSKGYSIDDMISNGIEWKAKDHFTRIIDKWDDYWNGEALHPSKITDELIEIDGKRVIAHYMQPHTPFLSTDAGPSKGIIWKTAAYFFHMLPENTQSKIKSKVNIPGSDKYSEVHERIAEEKGKEYLREVYKENLAIALADIKRFVEKHEDDKIIISADHGELLGENDMYSHPPEKEMEELIHVPWLEVEGIKD